MESTNGGDGGSDGGREDRIGAADPWIGAVQQHGVLPDRRAAYAALKAVLHTLRDRLPLSQAMRLGDGLPLLIRELFYEAWWRRTAPSHQRRNRSPLEQLRQQLGPSLEPERALRAVLRALAERLPPELVNTLRDEGPHEWLRHWPAAADAPACHEPRRGNALGPATASGKPWGLRAHGDHGAAPQPQAKGPA